MIIAVVGTGSVGRRHIANLVGLGHQVVAVSEHRRLDQVAVGSATVPAVASLGEALDRGCSAVFVANPTHLHAATTQLALDAGTDVYLEKPAALTGPECTELAERAEAAGLVVAVGQQLRFHPLVADLEELLRSGRLGRVVAVDANWGEHLADYHPDEDYRESYAARRSMGGGVLLTQIHLPDLVVSLFGPIASVSAAGGHWSDLEIDVEDTVTFLARTTAGVPISCHLDYLQRPKRSTITVVGTDGSASVDLHAGSLTLEPAARGGTPETIRRPLDRNDLFVAAAGDFLDAVGRGTAPRCGLRAAASVLDLVDAIKASMASGHDVAVSRVEGPVDPLGDEPAHG